MRRGAQEILRTPKPQATLPASQADASGAFIASVEQDKNPAAGSRPQNSRHRKDSVHHGSTEHMLREILENLPQGGRLLQLVDNLLRWSRSQMGDRKFSAKDVALGPVIQRVAELQRQVAAEKGITINTNLPDHVVTIDQDMIEAVLRNLIFNAIKFTDQDGAVDVNTRQLDNGRIEISVADSGVGIEDEHLQNLFEFTAETSRNGTHGEPGTGLGLQICAEFAAAHGSEIDVKSTLGEGSSFRFSVPTAE